MNTEETLEISEEEETVDTTPSNDTEIEEPSMEEAEEETSQEPSTERLYAGKYKSPEELERGYQETNAETARMAKELAQLRKEVAESKLSPEEREQKEKSRNFVKENNLLTREEFEQAQKDEREAGALMSKGATPKQIERVKRISQYGDYSKMSVTEIYKDLYGGLPGKKPTTSVKSKGVQRTGERTMTRAKFSSLKVNSPEFNDAEQRLYKGELKLVD